MKFTLISLVLILVLVPACSRQATLSTLTPTPHPTLPSTATTTAPGVTTVPSKTTTFAPTLTLRSTPLATETPVPLPSPTSTPTLQPVEGYSPLLYCGAAFYPAGFTPDGKSLVGIFQKMDTAGVSLQLLDMEAMAAKTLLKTDENITAAALSPDGQTFAWALPDFSIQLIHLPDGKITAALTGHTGAIYALLFSPDGNRLYSTSADWSIMVWDIVRQVRQTSFQPVFLDANVPGEVQGLGISSDGTTLITIPTYGNPRAWDTTTFKQLGEYRAGTVAGYTGSHASFSPDGKYLAIGFASGPSDTTLWRVADTTQLWSGGMMAGFAFSPDARLFAHTEQDENNRNHIVIRSADGQTVIQTIPALSDAAITQLMFSPDSRMLVWMDSPVLRFWDIAGKRLLNTYVAPCQ